MVVYFSKVSLCVEFNFHYTKVLYSNSPYGAKTASPSTRMKTTRYATRSNGVDFRETLEHTQEKLVEK